MGWMVMLLSMLAVFWPAGYAANISQSGVMNRQRSPDKKLIEYGWDVPDTEFISYHISEMETKPFDGVCFKISDEVSMAFERRPWSEAEMRMGTMASIPWRKFTDNFLILWVQGPEPMSWYDEAHWKIIEGNMRLISKTVRVGQVKGVFFDPEFYFTDKTHSPWVYNTKIYPGRRFEDVEKMVRQRGRQFISALQAEKPDIIFHSLFLTSVVGPKDRMKASHYALLPAFLSGMLEAAGPQVRFVDGNEGAYYHDETRKYAMSYKNIHLDAMTLLDDALFQRYEDQVQIGDAVYADLLLGLWPETEHGWPEDYKLKWLEHNVYHSLLDSDQYVWFYSENLDWWRKPVPAAYENALIRARERIQKKQALGYDMAKNDQSLWDDNSPAVFTAEPHIELNSSADGQILENGSRVLVTGEALNGQVDSVEFYLNNDLYKTVDSLPYALELTGLPSGYYDVMARAFDSSGHWTSRLISFKIKPSALFLPLHISPEILQ